MDEEDTAVIEVMVAEDTVDEDFTDKIPFPLSHDTAGKWTPSSKHEYQSIYMRQPTSY